MIFEENAPDNLPVSDIHAYLEEARAARERRRLPSVQKAAAIRNGEAYAALQSALEFLHPHEPAGEKIRDLRKNFPCAAALCEAPKHLLESVGFTPRDALLFSQMPAIARYVARSSLGPKPFLKNLTAAVEFCRTRYTGLAIEHFYLLCLDSSGRLIDSILLQSGSTDSAPFYVRHVLMEVVRTRAHAIVISHNHPNFSPKPSQADITCTLELLGALHTIGTVLLDHIIISDQDYASLREHGFVRSHLWLGQNPKDPLLRKWLD